MARHSDRDEIKDFEDAVHSIRSGLGASQAASALISAMTGVEKLSMLDGDEPFWPGMRSILYDRYNRKPYTMGAVPRLKIPGVKFTDGPRGIVMHNSTCFPVAMARGATWDVELERRIGNAIGKEGRAQGANYFAGICINLPRHPAWGRAQETYSEDPILLGAFGVALHRGVSPHLMTCVKHFALNSMENARFKVDVNIDLAPLHEVYLAHFRQVVDAGVTSVMCKQCILSDPAMTPGGFLTSTLASYNSLRGEFAGQNDELLNGILRKQWGFDGFVLSDFIFGLRDAVKSVKNGLDIEAPFQQQRVLHLAKALESGELQWSDVERSCNRILQKQLEHVARTGTEAPDSSVVFSTKHRDLAREAALRSMVLLKNEPVESQPLLPLKPDKIKRLAIVGRLANQANTGDRGSSAVFSPSVVTLYEGLKASLPNTEVLLEDSDSAERAGEAASKADMTICVVGYDAGDEGEYVVPTFDDNPELAALLPPVEGEEDTEVERKMKGHEDTAAVDGSSPNEGIRVGDGGDRRSLRLRSRDVEVINATTKASSNVIVIIVASEAVIMEEWLGEVPAVLFAWYSGCEGGHALADVLLGRVDTSGRLPFSIPKSEEQLPLFDIDARKITYDRWFGQRLLDKLAVPARYPLGWGLSYTTFALRGIRIDEQSISANYEQFNVRVKVNNTGSRAGRHVVQIYGLLQAEDFPSRVLLGFTPASLGASEDVEVEVSCSLRPTKRWNSGGFQYAAKEVKVEAASFAGDKKAVVCSLALP
ncbi:hypothetical protein LTS14_008290 [Recurvomyces mirabilis]|uniref:uncharacterized protein n=1 Tax=Recurvomyces mirabilis TaxID=574656 RepID=UPI002DDE4183|nr:hypothetical protein LTS14_008290 [Recurvomyces mirabilis]